MRAGIGAYGTSGGDVLGMVRQVGGRVVLLADMALEYAGQTGAQVEIGRLSFQHDHPAAGFEKFAGDRLGDTEADAYLRGGEFAWLLVTHWPAIQCWQLSCESQGNKTPDAYRRLAAFELGGVRELHNHGRQSCVLNMGTGVAEPQDYVTYFSDLLAEARYLGMHAYGSEAYQLMQAPDASWYALRYRPIVAAMRAAGKRCPPIVLTECTTWLPWHGKLSPDAILGDLQWLGGEMAKDPYVVGACGFQIGSPDREKWGGFDLSDPAIIGGLGRWNRAHPAGTWEDAVSNPVEVPTMPSAPTATIGNGFKVRDLRGRLPTKGAYERRPLSAVKYLVCHHVGTEVVPRKSAEDVARIIAEYHVNSLGWPGVGYGFLVSREGLIYQLNDLDTVSYHVAGRNRECLGVCLEGNFTATPPPQVQLTATRQLMAELQFTLGAFVPVCGHQDVAKSGFRTACPGETWHAWKGAVTVAAPVVEVPPPPAGPQFVLGFLDLANALGAAVVGTPTEPEHLETLTVQRTSTGMMMWKPGEAAGFWKKV